MTLLLTATVLIAGSIRRRADLAGQDATALPDDATIGTAPGRN
jgi:hypothetical protein